MTEWFKKQFDFGISSPRTLLFKRFTSISILLLSLATMWFGIYNFREDKVVAMFSLLLPLFLFVSILNASLESALNTKASSIVSASWKGFVAIPWLFLSVGCVVPGIMVPVIFNWVYLGNLVGALVLFILLKSSTETQHN
jgi:hypothetical protein